MKCPVCSRDLAPTLSICPSCGAMMNDSVREELQSKITSGPLSKRPLIVDDLALAEGYDDLPLLDEPDLASDAAFVTAAAQADSTVRVEAVMNAADLETSMQEFSANDDLGVETVAASAEKPLPLAMRIERPSPPIRNHVQHPSPLRGRGPTAELASGKTSPTLVGFQNKANVMPDWRLEMQNAARKRLGLVAEPAEQSTAATAAQQSGPAIAPVIEAPAFRMNGAAAIKAETVPQTDIDIPDNADPRLASALARINASRTTFRSAEPVRETAPARVSPATKNYPFNVIQPTFTPSARTAPAVSRPTAVESKPAPTPVKQVISGGMIFESKRDSVSSKKTASNDVPLIKFDTNKLPKIASVLGGARLDDDDPNVIEMTRPSTQTEFDGVNRIVINAEHENAAVDDIDGEYDEIEDLAPFTMRFNAGLFDLIIGIVITMVLLSPLALAGGSWVSLTGTLTFTATLAAVMFIYLTASVGFLGKTLGMRLFSLEIVDAEENEYPTLHQAAVSSSLYLVSLLFAGAGFVTIFFNEEKRAVHDLMSGTIVVREF